MKDKLENLILKRLIIFPGIVGISSINLNESNDALDKKNFRKGILIKKKIDGLIISISLITKHNINNIIMVKEINVFIKNILKEKKIKLSDLKIYIRGVN